MIDDLFIKLVKLVALILVFLAPIFFRKYMMKEYADKKNEMYILEFNIIDKLYAIISFCIVLIGMYIFYPKWLASSDTIIVMILLILLSIIYIFFVFRTKVLFDNKRIEFYNFWRTKQVIFWKDVKKMIYENANYNNMILRVKGNKEYKITTSFSGLSSFVSTYKIRNKFQ